ncbi:protein FAM200C-like [Macrobrachium nipponense]|uniref:protein FAM200C-like n=1 Tax=Macrobrachium nipponense TaxID=159736 RepID=UPI0030C8BC48
MAPDILSQVTIEILESSYSKVSFESDESCDVASCAVLLWFIHYIHQDKIKEEFLLCENLLTTTKVFLDGAPSMIGGHRGLQGLIQAVNPEISVDHCIIHRYSIGLKSLPGNLKLAFEDVLKIINFIKSRIYTEMSDHLKGLKTACITTFQRVTKKQPVFSGSFIPSLYLMRPFMMMISLQRRNGSQCEPMKP